MDQGGTLAKLLAGRVLPEGNADCTAHYSQDLLLMTSGGNSKRKMKESALRALKPISVPQTKLNKNALYQAYLN